MLLTNPRSLRSAYPEDLQEILNKKAADESGAWLFSWDQINRTATPLWSLPDMAAALGVASISLKDESFRSPLGSFKALGAPIALMRLLLRQWHTHNLNPRDLVAGKYSQLLANVTVISATDGNHGKSLAAAARDIGCQCVIVLHANVSAEREEAIAQYGAKIVRIAGGYDESVEYAAELAKENGWNVVSDTSYEGYEAIPRDVMQGYGVISSETIVQLESSTSRSPVTHVFLQGGVGGLAAGVASYLWEHYGAERPQFIVVEPQQADCLYQSAIAGHATTATGTVDSVMAGLACGEASPLAWKILERCVDQFMTISDNDAIDAMRTLSTGTDRDPPLVVGESGAAGFAGLTVLMRSPEFATAVGLGADSHVLVINTEGATAPSVYRELVGESAEAVLARQREWMKALEH
ncbi:diaminopropionate ammonia-lyase [Paraburkholderia fungorum]|uniref:Diaminopropionate ammonia-lyase n=1 Tax=Paraburkholderia fungorum TaxID=134537 RepID=A0A1H1I3Z0_9BURK|nr:diaminopropionate ammonia-lyase [Paraburkholderia fungorum]SDR32445.1 diaminopropionate ammonia-lyase [Paraburkholderia fungorum]